jgi:hypothetical protein
MNRALDRAALAKMTVGYSCLAALVALLSAAAWQMAIHQAFLNLRAIEWGSSALALIVLSYVILERKWKKGRYVGLAVPLLIVLSGQAPALLSISIFACASLGVGLRIYRAFDARIDLQKVMVAFFIGVSVNSYLVWGLMHLPINYPAVYYAAFAAEIVLSGRSVRESITRVSFSAELGSALAVLAIAGAFFVSYALVPNYQADDVLVHLYIPKFVLLNGFWAFDPQFIPALDTAIVPRSTYTSVFLMGNEYAVRLFNLLEFFSAFILTTTFVREKFGARAAFLSLLCILTTPFLLWQMGIVLTDSFQMLSAAIVLVLTYSVLQKTTNRNIVLYFVVAGFAFLHKQHAVFILLPTGVAVGFAILVRLFRERRPIVVGYTAVGVLTCAALIAMPLLHNYAISGNPLFPYYNAIFGSEWFVQANFTDGRWQHALRLSSLFDITVHGTKYVENMDFSFGFTFFVVGSLAPLVFLRREGRAGLGLVLFIFAGCVLGWYQITSPYMRYFVTCLPVGAVLVGVLMDRILNLMVRRTAFIATCVIFGVLFALNFASQMSLVNFSPKIPIVEAVSRDFSGSGYEAYLAMRRVFDYANVKYGQKSRGLLVEAPFMYFADFHAETTEWYHYHRQQEIGSVSANGRDLLRTVFGDDGFDFVIMPENPRKDLVGFSSDKFLEGTQKEFSSYGLAVFSRKRVVDAP